MINIDYVQLAKDMDSVVEYLALSDSDDVVWESWDRISIVLEELDRQYK